MRSIADRNLPEPYRSWIDPAQPLPPEVRLLPRSVDVSEDAITFVALGSIMGGMGVLFVALPPWSFDPAIEGWGSYLALGAVCLLLWSVPLLLLRRLLHTVRAQRDLAQGTLRQGVLVGPQALLVRMEPNRCHLVPAERFVEARIRPAPPRGVRRPVLDIETLDGTIADFARRLTADPQAINAAVRERRRSSRKARSKGTASRNRA